MADTGKANRNNYTCRRRGGGCQVSMLTLNGKGDLDKMVSEGILSDCGNPM